jgi:hypothetical protein
LSVQDIRLTVPTTTELSSAAGWTERDRSYIAVRHHLYLRHSGNPGPLHFGEVVSGVRAPDEITSQLVSGYECEVTNLSERESLSELILSESSVSKAGADLLQNLFHVSAEDTSSISERTTETTHTATTVRTKVSFNVTANVPAGYTNTLCVVRAYRRVIYDVYLVFSDALQVNTSRIPLSRIGATPPLPSPASKDWTRRPNVLRNGHGLPVCRISYWEPIDSSCILLAEEELATRSTVDRPHDVSIAPLAAGPTQPFPTESVPSLYRLASVAFKKPWRRVGRLGKD